MSKVLLRRDTHIYTYERPCEDTVRNQLPTNQGKWPQYELSVPACEPWISPFPEVADICFLFGSNSWWYFVVAALTTQEHLIPTGW